MPVWETGIRDTFPAHLTPLCFSLSTMVPGAFLIDAIPILKYVPEWFPDAKFWSKATDAKICSNNAQHYICGDRGVNGM